MTSESYGWQPYSDYPKQFPNFSRGIAEKGKFSDAFELKGEANVLFAEAGMEGKFAGAGLGWSAGGNGKIVGVNFNSNDNKGIRFLGWQSTFRGEDNSLEVGGGASFGAGVSYRQKFDLNNANFKKDNAISYNGIFTSSEVNTASGDVLLSWSLGGKAALGFGVNGELKFQVNLSKLADAINSNQTKFSHFEQTQMSANGSSKGKNEFKPEKF